MGQGRQTATMACDRVPHRGDVPYTQAGQSCICESANECQNWAKRLNRVV